MSLWVSCDIISTGVGDGVCKILHFCDRTMISPIESEWVRITQWAALSGKWSFSQNTAHYDGRTTERGHGLAICDERFRDGVIRTKVRVEGQDGAMRDGSAGIVLGYNMETEGYLIAGLGAFDQAYCIWEYLPSTGWLPRKAAGAVQNLRVNRDYQVEATQKGQRITLVVDGVPVLEHVLPSPLPGNQLGLFTMTDSPVLFQDFEVCRRQPTAFVAMQFGEPYDTIYRTVIRPKAHSLGFEVTRIDEVNRPGIIFQDIQKKIEDAKVVIAEITAPNQNVYYEVGYAQCAEQADDSTCAARPRTSLRHSELSGDLLRRFNWRQTAGRTDASRASGLDSARIMTRVTLRRRRRRAASDRARFSVRCRCHQT